MAHFSAWPSVQPRIQVGVDLVSFAPFIDIPTGDCECASLMETSDLGPADFVTYYCEFHQHLTVNNTISIGNEILVSSLVLGTSYQTAMMHWDYLSDSSR